LEKNQKLEMESQELYNLSESTEIGCMCEKCDCNKLVTIAVSICESRLSNKHTSKIDIQFSA